MNYVGEILDRINAELPDLEPDLAQLYALLALTRGQATTLQDVHDAWSVWRHQDKPDHAALLPFDRLAPEVQELDRKYRDGIHRAALT